MNLLTWSPNQPKQVREILEHATPSERRRCALLAGAHGGFCGLTIAGAFVPIAYLMFGESLHWLLVTIIVVTAAVLLVGAILFTRRAARKMLCNFEWAREQGITVESLKLGPW